MKNLFRNIFLVSCLLLTVGAVEAQAQTAQQAVRHQPLPAKVALKNAKEQLATIDPQSARYADLQGKIAQLETKVQQSKNQKDVSSKQARLETAPTKTVEQVKAKVATLQQNGITPEKKNRMIQRYEAVINDPKSHPQNVAIAKVALEALRK